jgi:hypothetical protein
MPAVAGEIEQAQVIVLPFASLSLRHIVSQSSVYFPQCFEWHDSRWVSIDTKRRQPYIYPVRRATLLNITIHKIFAYGKSSVRQQYVLRIQNCHFRPSMLDGFSHHDFFVLTFRPSSFGGLILIFSPHPVIGLAFSSLTVGLNCCHLNQYSFLGNLHLLWVIVHCTYCTRLCEWIVEVYVLFISPLLWSNLCLHTNRPHILLNRPTTKSIKTICKNVRGRQR